MKEEPDPVKVIFEWWKTRTDEEKEEALLVLDVLSDNDSTPRMWLQLMVGHYGSRFVMTAIECCDAGLFQKEEVKE